MASRIKYVTLLPSGRGFGRAVEGQVDDALGKSEKKTNGFFSKVGTGLKRLGVGIGVVAGTVATLAVGGGISRALNIEDAQAKLKGLGHDTKAVEGIMTDALAAVKGTAFGLDAAATTAAAAVAAGIKPGQELERYLKLTADAATIAGVSMEEMGSIMNKVQSKGRAQMEDLNRLTERGVPIMQMLAEEYGVTAGEMEKMVSRGEVDAERFRKALEENVGGAALASGDTTRGAFANMRAAMSRLGEVFAGPALDGAKVFFREVTEIFDGLTDRAKPFVDGLRERFGGMFNIDGLGEGFLSGFDRMVTSISTGPIPQLLSALQPILPALGEAAMLIGGALGDAFFELGEALAPVLPLISETLADAIVELTPSLTDLLVALIPLIPPLVELLAAVTPLAVELIDSLMPAIEWTVEAVAGFVEALSPLIDLLRGDIGFGKFADEAAKIQGPFGEFLEGPAAAGQALGAFLADILGFVNDARAALEPFLNGIREYFSMTWNTISTVVSSVLMFIHGLLTGNLGQMKAAISQALSAISGWWSSTWNGLSALLGGVWSNISAAVSSGINRVVSYLQALPGRVLGAIGNLGGLLFNAGQDVMRGLINGIGSMIESAAAAARNAAGSIVSAAKGALGIHSPSRVFRDEVGKMVGLGLLEGIEDQAIQSRIDGAVSHLVSVPDGARAAGLPEVINLLDADGSILARTRVVADRAIDTFVSQTGAAMRYAQIGG